MTDTATVQDVRAEIEEAVAPSIAHAFAASAAVRGDEPYLSDKVGIEGPGWRTLTWADVRRTALDVAGALVDLGIQRGDTVAIMASNRVEHTLADMATMHAGAVAMSIYNTLSPDQVAYIAGQARPTLAVLENADHVARWRQVLEADGAPIVVVLDPEAAPEGALTWSQLVDRGREVRDRHAAEVEARWTALTHDDPATILYTSGTTGPPKGVVIDQGAVLFSAESGLRRLGLAEDDSIAVSYLPYAHIAERVLAIYIPQIDGVNRAQHLHLIGDPLQLVPALGEVHPTRFFGVPRVWEKLQTGVAGLLAMEPDEDKKRAVQGAMAVGLEYVESLQNGHQTSPELQARYDAADAAVLTPIKSMIGLDQVTWAACASAPLALETARFAAGLGLSVYDIYGLSETTGAITGAGPGCFRLGHVGQALPGMEVVLADDGEVLCRARVNTVGYHHNPDATAALIDAAGWLHTGDIGEMDDDGFLRIVDRKKELIITSAGKNIAPSNIEGLLKESPLVGQALAFGDGRPYVVAVLTLDPEVAPVVAAQLGLEGDLPALAREPVILERVGEAVEAANARLSRPEQVKRWELLPAEWTAESGELTPTLKLKRRVIHSTYADSFEGLYADGGAQDR
ncbi:long-chain fatty acid--CoA ligase [Nocardioides sp.]|uniref:AMP-dependent synthetase/ligase n=1 Tax=Nocardioides sp. TaxID=35761 RepID=UPI00352793A4